MVSFNRLLKKKMFLFFIFLGISYFDGNIRKILKTLIFLKEKMVLIIRFESIGKMLDFL